MPLYLWFVSHNIIRLTKIISGTKHLLAGLKAGTCLVRRLLLTPAWLLYHLTFLSWIPAAVDVRSELVPSSLAGWLWYVFTNIGTSIVIAKTSDVLLCINCRRHPTIFVVTLAFNYGWKLSCSKRFM